MDVYKDAWFLGNKINLRTQDGFKQLFDLIDSYQESGQLNSQTMTAIKLAGLLDNALRELETIPKMNTFTFRVEGTGRIPMDQLLRFGLFPADQHTSDLMEDSFFGKPYMRTFRFAMNTTMNEGIAWNVIKRFQSFGFSCKLIEGGTDEFIDEKIRTGEIDVDDVDWGDYDD